MVKYDEAVIGNWPNIAIEAGSDPAEVMREHGRADNGVEVDNGAEVDTREKLEADAENLLFEFGHYCATSREGLTDDVDVFIGDFTDLLDRQAAITERELCGRCSPYATAKDYLDTIDSLTAERDALKEQINSFNAPKSEEIAENDTSKGVLNNFDAQNDSREKLEADIRAWHRDTPFATKPSVQTLLGWLDRQAAITERELCVDCEWPLLAAQPDEEAYDRIAELEAERDALKKLISQSDAPEPGESAENGTPKDEIRDFDDTREKLETDILFEYLEFPGDQNRIFAYLDRQAAITRAECKNTLVHFAERLQLVQNGYDAAVRDMQPKVDELTAERDILKERVARFDSISSIDGIANLLVQFEDLTAERDRLQAKVDELNASWRKANDGWAEANAEAERLQHANNTLRASVAGLKMTVERFKARESGDARQSG